MFKERRLIGGGCYSSEGASPGGPQRELGRLWRQPGGPWRQLGGFKRQLGRVLKQLGGPQRQLGGVLGGKENWLEA